MTRKTAVGVSALVAGVAVLSPAIVGWQRAPGAAAAVLGDEVAWPKTAAGNCARDYFAAFNGGDDAALRAFEETYRAPSALAERPVEERVKRFAQLRGEWKSIRPLKVLSSEPARVTVLAFCEREQGEMLLEFEFESAQTKSLKGIIITNGLKPGEAERRMAPLTAEQKRAAIEGVITALNENYVYPETAAKIEESLRTKLAGGAYDGVRDVGALAARLMEDARAVCNDKHLRVLARPFEPPKEGGDGHPDLKEMRERNFGYVKVEQLAGNIGFVRLDAFAPGAEAQATAAAALGFVQNCDALIFDLRSNGGGSPEMIQFISSYLFDTKVHLNSFFDRDGKQVSETWTLESVPGKRFANDLPVYVLTSGRTFSAAEEFTYNLQNLKRATIVGETTGGGAHPVKPVGAGDMLTVIVPFERAFNPISKTNWEGTGIEPDIKCPAPDALDAAVKDATEKVKGRRTAR